MRLVTFSRQGRVAPGVIEGDRVWDLSEGGRVADLGALVARPGFSLDRLSRGEAWPLNEVALLAPIPRPPKLVAVALNYRRHAEEQGKRAPDFPVFLGKASACVIGPGQPILLPPGREEIDPEVELAVVIGWRAERVSAARALDHVLGFTIANDVSDRAAQRQDGQFYRAKSWSTFGPLGPAVVTPDEVPWEDAAIRLRCNGEVRQDSRTSDLVHPVPRLVELLSAIHPLEPGDVILTGTPEGVGVHRRPPVFLRPGDRVECEIEGIGALVNPVAASPPAPC